MGSLSMYEVASDGNRVVLVAEGIVDDGTVEQFEDGLDDAIGVGRPLVVDLTACQLESAGLSALIRLQRSPERCPESTHLVATDRDLLWTLQVVGLTYWCQVFPTLDAALRVSSPARLSLVGAQFE